MRKLLTLLLAGFHVATVSLVCAERGRDMAWPEAAAEQRPWTRWWWMGSAVDKSNLTRQLTLFQEAGLGGVEICPIYGVKGYEDRFLPFLSPSWVEMLAHTLREAERLGLGVDLTTGTGWPFGGPQVTTAHASGRLSLKDYELEGGQTHRLTMPQGELVCLWAVPESGESIELTGQVGDRVLEWVVPPGPWHVYALATRRPAQKVKRPAPGGEGNVLDPYSVKALDHYLASFDKALAGFEAGPPRAHFHDSFEYYGAEWTEEFFEEFQKRRGYALKPQLPALFDDGEPDKVARIKSDFRETISDLHLDYVGRWTEWAHNQGSLTRNQAHGAPGNLLDLYAAPDIPETEIFGSADGEHLPMLRFASSAAHVSGRRLVSAETCTWLDEHFQTSLAQVKVAVDYLFLAGVNHILFHGIPYSPAEAAWPGWQFYASVNFGPEGGLWKDLPAFNGYATRVQSVLQSGRPDHDVLLYFPFHDLYHTAEGLLLPFTVHNVQKWLGPHAFHGAAVSMGEQGHAFDYLSDRFLEKIQMRGDRLMLGGVGYRTIVVPDCERMPVDSLSRLWDLARRGASVIFLNRLPRDVPGWNEWTARKSILGEMVASLNWEEQASWGKTARLGEGRFLVGSDLEQLLSEAGVNREPMVDQGLHFVRRAHARGHHYFLVHQGETALDGWVTLSRTVESVVILDPLDEQRRGMGAVRHDKNGRSEVYLQMRPGQSLVLRTFGGESPAGSRWIYVGENGRAQALDGEWDVEYLEGGPHLPKGFRSAELGWWNERDDAESKRFAGTACYTLEFEHPGGEAQDWRLDLGQVGDSARIRLNGGEVGTLWSLPLEVRVGAWLKPGRNRLEIEVTNLAANRVRDLDQRGVQWKYFYDINVVNKQYKPLDASSWPLRPSGLAGPVTLTPLLEIRPEL